jgi:acetyltransferase-like isoleucine patch superfamily enzyme
MAVGMTKQKEQTEGRALERTMSWLSPFYIWPLKLVRRLSGMTAVSHAVEYLPVPARALIAFGAGIGTDTIIYPRLTVHGAQGDFGNLHVGNEVRILRNCLLDLSDRITINDQAIVSFGCKLITHSNIYHSPLAQHYPPKLGPITIERGAVLFANVTVLMGITIGECAMVGAGSVVTRDVPPRTLVGGVPARVIKKLD